MQSNLFVLHMDRMIEMARDPASLFQVKMSLAFRTQITLLMI